MVSSNGLSPRNLEDNLKNLDLRKYALIDLQKVTIPYTSAFALKMVKYYHQIPSERRSPLIMIIKHVEWFFLGYLLTYIWGFNEQPNRLSNTWMSWQPFHKVVFKTLFWWRWLFIPIIRGHQMMSSEWFHSFRKFCQIVCDTKYMRCSIWTKKIDFW